MPGQTSHSRSQPPIIVMAGCGSVLAAARAADERRKGGFQSAHALHRLLNIFSPGIRVQDSSLAGLSVLQIVRR